MARLADTIELTTGDHPIELRPTLRAALRLTREFGGIGPLFLGISEGSITVLTRMVRECSVALADPFSFLDGRPYAVWHSRLAPAALQLVEGFFPVDRDTDPAPTRAEPSRKPFDATKHFEDLFGFSTGILKWTPEAAWNATPGEIIAAMKFRERVYAPKTPAAKDEVPHDKLTLTQQARKLFANVGTKIVEAPRAS